MGPRSRSSVATKKVHVQQLMRNFTVDGSGRQQLNTLNNLNITEQQADILVS